MPDLPYPVLEQAAEWYALLRSGEAAEGDRADWRVWLEADPDHRRAWSRVEAVGQRFAPIQAAPDPRRAAESLWTANARTRTRRRMLTGLAGAGLLAWAGWRHTPAPGLLLAHLADHHTATGERRDVRLGDGTRVWLNTATAFDADYRADLRRLRLIAGEILIETAADARPFVVDTPHGRLRALGTRFAVHLDGAETHVAVFGGAVEARPASGSILVLKAGQQTRFTAAALAAPEPADIAREAWSRGVLIARDVPLETLVRELGRYRVGHLGVAPEVAGLRVFGSFPLHDTDEALAMLSAALPVRVRRPLPWWVTLEAKDPAASDRP